MVISQHITRGERATQGRAAVPPTELELSFSEEQFATPQWRCRFSMAPMGRGLLSLYSMEVHPRPQRALPGARAHSYTFGRKCNGTWQCPRRSRSTGS